MAKQANSEQLNLDDYDFGNEFDFDEFDLEPKPVKNKREAIERVGAGAWEGAKDTVKSASFFRDFVKKALPRGYGNMLDMADQTASSVRDLYNDGLKETKPLLKDVARSLDKMMPAASKYLPKGAKDLADKFIASQRDPEQVGIGANNATDMAVALMMADTFKYNAKEGARREAKDDAREVIRDNAANERHGDSIAQLDGIRKSVVSMAAYQRRVEFGYQKKSLELQARSYFVAVDMLNETKRQNLRTTEMLSGILNNTALPDLLKMKTSERFKAMLRDKAISGLQDGIFGQRANFMQNIGTAFRDQALGSLRNFAGGVRDGLSGIEMAQDAAQMGEDMGMDKFRMGGNVLGGEATKWLSGLAATKVGKKIMGSGNGRAKAVRRVGNQLQHAFENFPQLATDYSNTMTDTTSTADGFLERIFGDKLSDGKRGVLSRIFGFIGDPLTDLAKGTVRRANAMDNKVKETGVGDMYLPSAFTNQAHKTLVEVIPGLLARQLQELQIARTGNTKIDLVQYDFSRGKFSDTKALRKDTFNRLFDQRSRDGVKYEKDQLLNMVDPAGKLTPEQREELSNILMNDNLRGRPGYETGKISNYTRDNSFGESQHGAVYAELFRELAAKDQANEGDSNIDFASRFRNVGRSMANRKNEIQQLLELYPRDMLEDMGLLKPGSTEVDMQKVNSYFAGKQYQAKGALAIPGLRQLGGAVNNMSTIQLPPMPGSSDGDTPTSNPVVEEIRKLIALVETQNTRPLTSDIKDILLAMQQELRERQGPSGPSGLDRILDGASRGASAASDAARGATQAATRQARRLRRQAQVAGRRFLNENQQRIDDARAQATQLAEEAKRQARRVKRRATVEAGRARQRMQPQIDQLGQQFAEGRERITDLWTNRPSVDDVQDSLRQRWERLRGRFDQARDHVHSDEFRDQVRQRVNGARENIQGMGSQLHRNMQNMSERARAFMERGMPGQEQESKGVLGEIKDILIAIRDRLEDGIITTGGVPEARLTGKLRRVGGAAKRGLARLNMSIVDLVKGTASLGVGTVKTVGRAAASLVGGGVRTTWGLAKGTVGLAADASAYAVNSQYRRARGFVDIYVGDERKPRMYGRMLQEGNVYFDKATGKPIRRLKDITGDVVRKTEAGEELVLAEDEIQHAWQKVGTVKKTLNALGATAKGAYGLGKKVFGVVAGGIPPVFKTALKIGKAAWGLLDMAQDIFVKDRLDSPVMTARLMRAGSYYSAVSYKAIKRPSQIDGPVLIGEGEQAETVLTHDDLRKGIVDKNGKPIRSAWGKIWNFTFGNAKRAAKLAWKVGKKVNEAVVGAVKNGYKLGKTVVKAGVKTIGGAFDIFRGKNPFASGPSAEITKKAVALQTESIDILKQIRDVLVERLPERKKRVLGDANGDGVRDGSYEDQMQQQAQAKKEAAEQQAATAGQSGGGFMAGAKALWDKLRGKNKEADAEDGDDTDININGGGNERTSKDERRRRRLARRPGGSWATSQGWKGKTKFLAGKAWGGVKGVGKFALGALPFLPALSLAGVGGAAATAGGAIATGAAAVGSGLLAAGGAIAGVLASPVVLGAAAVAAAGAGIYFGVKYLTRKKLGLLSRVRFVQYGFHPKDDDHVGAVFELEDKLKSAIIYGKDGAKIDPKQLKASDLVKGFDVDEKDREMVGDWVRWFSNRFKPVFLTHVTGLKSAASDKWLSDVDDLDPAVALKYLNLVKFPDGPYGEDVAPFKGMKGLPSGGGDVKAIIQIAETELQKKAPSAGKAGVVAGVAAGAAATSNVAKPGAGDKPAGTKAAGVSATVLAAAAVPAGATPAKGAQVMAAGSSAILESLGTDRLDGVDVVRLKTYGLVKMEVDKVKALQALEKYLAPKLLFNKNVATWSGSVEQVLIDNGPAFGVDMSNDALAANWVSWFNQRFLPTFLNYASLIKALTGKDDPLTGKVNLKPTQSVDVATALFTTSGSAGSVWNVSVSPWIDYATNTDVRSTDGNMQGLKDMAKSAVLVEPGNKGGNQPTANKSAANTQTQSTGVFSSIANFWQKTKASMGMATTAKTTIPTTQVGENPYGGSAPSGMAGGREMVHPGKGTGGDINSIPKPTGNKSWAAVKDTILAAAKMVGVDAKLMAAMAAIESGFDHTVKAGTSSATGLYQFISSTWDWMIKKYGAKYGIAPGTPASDARANALMGAEYLKENASYLEGKIGRPITDTDMYFAHFLGSGGARKFLTADPNALGASVLPDAARSNPSIFYNKAGEPLSVGQIYQLINSRVQNKAKGLINDGGEGVVASAPPKDGLPAAGGKTAGGDTAAAAAKPATAPVGLGMPGLPGDQPAKPAPLPPTAAVSGPNNNGVPIAAVMTGIAPPRPMQDQVASAKQQIEARITNLDATQKAVQEQLEVQKQSRDILIEIRDGLKGLAPSSMAQASQPAPSAPGTSQAARVAPRQSSELPRPPVSVARPRNPFS